MRCTPNNLLRTAWGAGVIPHARCKDTPWLQVLLAVYFFLAGVAVAGSRGRLLWLMPTAAVGCAVLLAVLALAFKALSPGFRCLNNCVCGHWSVGLAQQTSKC